MNLPTRNFSDLVRDMSSVITSSSGKLIDMSVGSVLRAIIEANAAIMLWTQWLIVLTLQTTRAATSNSTDLDSWMADYSFYRAPAVASSGTVTFSRYVANSPAAIPAGTSVLCPIGNIVFTVQPAPALSSWNPASGSYNLGPGVASVDLPVAASVPGSKGNVVANAITLLASPVPGIDRVNNQFALSGGNDPEPDDAFRARFRLFFAARSRATADAVAYQISLTDRTLRYLIQENVDPSGTPRPGNFVVFAASATGSTLSGTLFASVSQAIDSIRPIGSTFSVIPAVQVGVAVSMGLTLSPGIRIADISAGANNIIDQYVNSIPIGGLVSLTKMCQLMYDGDPRILNIANVLVNSQIGDLTAPRSSFFKLTAANYSQNGP